MHQVAAPSSPSFGLVAPARPTPTLPLSLFGVVLLACVANLFWVLGADVPWYLFLFTPIYAAYVTAAILVGLGVLSRLRGRPLLPVPLLSRHLRPATAYRALTLFVVAITFLREGSCSTAALDYNAFRFTGAFSYQSQSHTDSSGDRHASRMAGAPISCVASCSGTNATCKVAAETLCHQVRPIDAEELGLEPVELDVRVDFPEPFCYVPLFKSSELAYSADVTLSRASKHVSLTISGTVALEAVGPMSCRRYRAKTASTIREQIIKAINKTLEKN